LDAVRHKSAREIFETDDPNSERRSKILVANQECLRLMQGDLS